MIKGIKKVAVAQWVASLTRGPLFQSSRRQILYSLINCQLHWKEENKEKDAVIYPILKRKKERERENYKRKKERKKER